MKNKWIKRAAAVITFSRKSFVCIISNEHIHIYWICGLNFEHIHIIFHWHGTVDLFSVNMIMSNLCTHWKTWCVCVCEISLGLTLSTWYWLTKSRTYTRQSQYCYRQMQFVCPLNFDFTLRKESANKCQWSSSEHRENEEKKNKKER